MIDDEYMPTTDWIIRDYCYCPDCFINQFPGDMEEALRFLYDYEVVGLNNPTDETA